LLLGGSEVVKLENKVVIFENVSEIVQDLSDDYAKSIRSL
jgi:hypothetical protein